MSLTDPEELRATISRTLNILGIEPYLTSAQETASRVADMYREVFSGIDIDASEILEPLIPPPEQQRQRQLVILSSVSFFSMCEHHFLPFYGHIDIGYVVGDYIVGLGKLTRLVEVLTRRPQLQEKLTEEVAGYIEKSLKPSGVAVHVIARHLCEAMRGTREKNQVLSTFSFQGVLATDATYQKAFLKSISKSFR